MVQLDVLGSIRVLDSSGVQVDIGGARLQRIVLALWSVGPSGAGHDVLAERVWDDVDRPPDPTAALRTYVSRLRGALEPGVPGSEAVIVRRIHGGYALDLEELDVDASRFEALADQASVSLDAGDRARLFAAGLELFRGTPFGDLGDLEWLIAERERLSERRLGAVVGLLDAQLELGLQTEVIATARRERRDHHFHDGLVRAEMLALYRSGRHADALAAFQEYRSSIVEELGIEVSSELRDLELLMLQQDSSLGDDRAGRPLRGYEVGEAIGAGAFSIVYRGRQPAVGRDVALKVIRSELANQPDFIRRFDVEARTVARLEHPHIVPLYDYWREPDSAYLVMRLLSGSLADRLLRGPLALDDAATVLDQIASALTVAHQAGVVHRDIKPANVLLDDAGNAFLSDFGIAVATDDGEPDAGTSEPTGSAGSPAYAAPEQLRGLSVGSSADTYSLGITAYEMLTGQLPWPDARSEASLLERQLNEPLPPVAEVRGAVPEAVEDVIARATEKDPQRRTGSVSEFAEAFRAAIEGTLGDSPPASPVAQRRVGVATLIGNVRNPFVGLRAFDEGDERLFHGRAALVGEMIESLAAPAPAGRLLSIVGASGSGKSSAVRAGLLPALRRGALVGSERWYVVAMTPGDEPFAALGNALLGVSTADPSTIESALYADGRGIARAIAVAAPDDGELVLFIDQFEELYTGNIDASTAERFITSLTDAVADLSTGLRVVVTLRADFTDRPLAHREFAPLFRKSLLTVAPMSAAEIEQAIVDPLTSIGGTVEPGLVAQIVADLASQPSGLPLLQFALREQFEREGAHLTLDGYREIGGIAGALVTRAEAVLSELTMPELEVLRAMIGRLAAVDSGGGFVRHRARRLDLASPGSAGDSVIDTLGRSRLFSFDRAADTREPTVELSHEALLTEWPRLRSWLEADRATVDLARQVGEAAQAWERDQRDPAGLVRGIRLDAAQQLLVDHPERLSATEHEFVSASLEQRQLEVQAESRRSRRLRRLALATGVVAVLAAVAGAVALVQRQRADDEAGRAEREAAQAQSARVSADSAREQAEEARAEAESARVISDALAAEAQRSELLARSAVEVRNDVDVGLLLAREAANRGAGIDAQWAALNALTYVPNVERTITESRLVEGQRLSDTFTFCHHLDADDNLIFGPVSPGPAASRTSVDLASGTVERTPLLEGQYCTHHQSPDGRYLAGLGFDGIEITDTQQQLVVGQFQDCGAELGWSGDGRYLHLQPVPDSSAESPRCYQNAMELVAVDPVTLSEERLVGPAQFLGANRTRHDRWVNFGLRDPDTGTAVNHRLDLDTLEVVDMTPLAPGVQPLFIDVGSEDDVLLVGTQGAILLIEAGSGALRTTIEVADFRPGGYLQAAMDDSGAVVAVSTNDTVQVYDAASGRATRDRVRVATGVEQVEWLDDGRRIALLLESGEVQVVDFDGGGLAATDLECCDDAAQFGGFVRFEDGGRYATVMPGFNGTGQGQLPVWIDLELGVSRPVEAPDAAVVIPRSDGSVLAFDQSMNGTVIDPDGDVIGAIVGPPGIEAVIAATSANGRLVLSGLGFDPDDNAVLVMDLEASEVPTVLLTSELPPQPQRSNLLPLANGNLLFGRVDGSLLETTVTGDVVDRWSVFDNETVARLVQGDGRKILSYTREGSMAIVDLQSGNVTSFPIPDPVIAGGFAPDGRIVAVGLDGRVRLWDIATRAEIGTLMVGEKPMIGGTGASSDTVRVALEASIVELPVDPETWFDSLCLRSTRELTESEWNELIPGGGPQTPICAAEPATG